MKYLCMTAIVAVAACAQSPDSVAPASMPSNMYSSMSCQSAATERTVTAQNLAALEAKQRSAVVGDAVGVFLIAVPVSSLTGGDKAGLLAVEKGKIIALDARLNECNVIRETVTRGASSDYLEHMRRIIE